MPARKVDFSCVTGQSMSRRVAIGAAGVGILLAFVTSGSAHAKSPSDSGWDQPFSDPRPVAGNPWFANAQRVLEFLVTRMGRRRVNDFCVIGQGDVDPVAYVHWQQESRLILWEPTTDDIDDLSKTRRDLNLKTDVHPDPQGSTFIVTPKWVASLLVACNATGQRFRIIKR
jgi:hypothetical protein